MNLLLTQDLAVSFARELFTAFINSMGTDISESECAKIISTSASINGVVCNDFDRAGVIVDNAYFRTVLIWSPHPYRVGHVCLTGSLDIFGNTSSVDNVQTDEPEMLGKMVLQKWNFRIASLKEKFASLRTIICVKGDDFSKISLMEIETKPFDPADYTWDWNSKNNLEGYEKTSGKHRFTWQPHGSQFTHIPDLPSKRLKLRVMKPPMVSREYVLDEIKFDPAWIEIVE